MNRVRINRSQPVAFIIILFKYDTIMKGIDSLWEMSSAICSQINHSVL